MPSENSRLLENKDAAQVVARAEDEVAKRAKPALGFGCPSTLKSHYLQAQIIPTPG